MFFDTEKLKREQLKFAKKVILKDKFDNIKLVAGVDRVYPQNNKIIAAIAVYDTANKKIIESKYAVREVDFPYVPSFLAYREMPAILECYDKLENKPDLLLIAGEGVLHPRMFGIASHIGIVLDLPTIGISKKRLCGDSKEGRIFLGDKIVGAEFKSNIHANPLYISIGNKISLGTAFRITQELTILLHKSPEPLHQAHKYAVKIKEKLFGEKTNGQKTNATP